MPNDKNPVIAAPPAAGGRPELIVIAWADAGLRAARGGVASVSGACNQKDKVFP
jgi:hypothetical protein